MGLYLFTASALGTLLASSLSLAHAHAKEELIVNWKVREARSQASDSHKAPGMLCFPATLSHTPSSFVVILDGGKARLGLRLGCPLRDQLSF